MTAIQRLYKAAPTHIQLMRDVRHFMRGGADALPRYAETKQDTDNEYHKSIVEAIASYVCNRFEIRKSASKESTTRNCGGWTGMIEMHHLLASSVRKQYQWHRDGYNVVPEVQEALDNLEARGVVKIDRSNPYKPYIALVLE
jgi:hypothetical protein